MERLALLADALLAGAQRTEVLHRFRHRVAVETHDDAARRLVADGDVKVPLPSGGRGACHITQRGGVEQTRHEPDLERNAPCVSPRAASSCPHSRWPGPPAPGARRHRQPGGRCGAPWRLRRRQLYFARVTWRLTGWRRHGIAPHMHGPRVTCRVRRPPMAPPPAQSGPTSAPGACEAASPASAPPCRPCTRPPG